MLRTLAVCIQFYALAQGSFADELCLIQQHASQRGTQIGSELYTQSEKPQAFKSNSDVHEECDWKCYLATYPDLSSPSVCGADIACAEKHFRQRGQSEGRNCNCPEACNWQCYLDRYADLRNALGATNIAAAQSHFQRLGQSEGRDCTCPESPTPALPLTAASFVKCAKIAHASVPASIKFDETLDNETAYYSASLADHIYVLCKQCDRTFPSNWKGKVTYVPATDADDCLDSGRMLHDEKVTRAHKLIVWAARNLKFRKILVLEEDFVLAPSTGLKATNSQALMEFIEAGEWDLLRLGYIARDVFVQSGQKRQCKPSCSCTVDVSCGDVCTTAPGCDLRSSVAYMIKEHLFEDFLAAQGVIDMGILQSFRQSYLIPPLFHQGGEKFAVGTELDKDFTASCVHGWI